jgi:hypothetical protein
MTDALAGSDFSWIGIDTAGRLGWFTLKGVGPAPTALEGDPSALISAEASMARWVRANGRAFEFGAGDTMWHDVAALGVFAFDFCGPADEYRAVAVPKSPLLDPPVDLEAVAVQLSAADFGIGCVSRTVLAGPGTVHGVSQRDEADIDAHELREELRRFRADLDLPVGEHVLDELVEDWVTVRRYGAYYTDEEIRRISPHQAAVDAAERRMQAYAAEHADTYAGRWREYQNGAPTLVVSFTESLPFHRAALDMPRVKVIHGKRPEAVLESIVDQISTVPLGPEHGQVLMWGPSPKRGVVFVRGRGSDAQRLALAERLSERFGDAVELDWNSPSLSRFG